MVRYRVGLERMLNSPALTPDLVRQAATRLQPVLRPTPVFIRDLNGTTLLLKAECLHPTGAFKIRGALNMMLSLPPDTPGVVAHSSGNHAWAVAYAGQIVGIPTVVVMPDDAPPVKRQRAESEGAEVVIVGPDSAERAGRAAEIAKSRGLVEVPPFDHPLIAAGQGTLAIELDEEGSYDRFYAPISGGGLMAGCATVLSDPTRTRIRPEIVGVEPVGGDDAKQSLESGCLTSVPPPSTIADGLRVRELSSLTWATIKNSVDRIETVTDEELLNAMAWAANELRLIIEPSGAAALALALREAATNSEPGKSIRAAVVLSGGNVDHELLQSILG